MCIAYPMKITALRGTMADVSAGSVKTSVSVQLIDKPKKGDYVLVHAGIAIEKVNRSRAHEILSLISELGQKIDRKYGKE